MRDQSGFSQGSIRVHGVSVRVHSVRVQSGFSQGSGKFNAGSVKIQSRFSEGSVAVQSGFSQGAVKVLCEFSHGSSQSRFKQVQSGLSESNVYTGFSQIVQ